MLCRLWNGLCPLLQPDERMGQDFTFFALMITFIVYCILSASHLHTSYPVCRVTDSLQLGYIILAEI